MNVNLHKLFICGLLLLVCSAWAQPSFPYSLKKRDYAIGTIGIGSVVTGALLAHRNHNISLAQIQELQPSQVNKFDRIATRQWSLAAKHFSDIPVKVLPLTPIAMAIPQFKQRQLKQALTLGVMYTETMLLTVGFTSIAKSWVGRTRPYLYNTSFTSAERFDLQTNGGPTASTSFFSGHTSTSFALAFLVSKMCTDIYGKKTWCKIVWGTSVSLATVTGLARIKAGVHYPTDVITGALVGGAIGYFVPVLHKSKKENLTLLVVPGHFNIQYRF